MGEDDGEKATEERYPQAQITQAIFVGVVAVVFSAVGLLLPQGWRSSYSVALVVNHTCAAFVLGCALRSAVDKRFSLKATAAVVILNAVFTQPLVHLYFPGSTIGSAYILWIVFAAAVVGFAITTVEAFVDYTTLTLLSIAFEASLDLDPVMALWPWAIIAAALAAIFRMRGPEHYMDLALLTPCMFLVSAYALPLDSADVRYVPLFIAVAVLVVLSLVLRRSRLPQASKVLLLLALATLGAVVLLQVAPPAALT